MKRILYYLLTIFACMWLSILSIHAESIGEALSIRQIVDSLYNGKAFFVGSAGLSSSFNLISGQILCHEFSYVTPANDFKISEIHPYPNKWDWEKSDQWMKWVDSTHQIVRLHAPIGPQVSKWYREDFRKEAEMRKAMDEFLIAIYQRYASHPAVKWVDVVNETIFHEKAYETKGNLYPGSWFTRRSGIDKWENPWTILGYDKSTELKVPLYIDRAFELADKYAPNVKHVFNQQGRFEPEVWAKVKLVLEYLIDVKQRRVDAVGWQAHIDAGWEKVPGNLQSLSEFIDWCHARKMEFHITEFNVYTARGKYKYSDAAQSATVCAITKLLISKLNTGTIAINFWNIKDDETGEPEWKGAIWDVHGVPKQAYFDFKRTLIEGAN